MSNCVPVNCNQDVPVPTPTPLPPCPEGEPCKDVVDAHCVVYTNEPLPPVNVETNDRLNDIIRKWAQGVQAGTQAVSTGTTSTTSIQGNGTVLQPLQVDVRVSSRPQNLLRVVNEVDENNVQRIGLEVLLSDEIIASILTQIIGSDALTLQFCNLVKPCLDNDEIIASILTRIIGSDTLSLQFCELVRPCLDNTCGIATGLQVQPL